MNFTAFGNSIRWRIFESCHQEVKGASLTYSLGVYDVLPELICIEVKRTCNVPNSGAAPYEALYNLLEWKIKAIPELKSLRGM